MEDLGVLKKKRRRGSPRSLSFMYWLSEPYLTRQGGCHAGIESWIYFVGALPCARVYKIQG